jgi:hypothetical protein
VLSESKNARWWTPFRTSLAHSSLSWRGPCGEMAGSPQRPLPWGRADEAAAVAVGDGGDN